MSFFSLQTNRNQGPPWYLRGKAVHAIHILLRVPLLLHNQFEQGEEAALVIAGGRKHFSDTGRNPKWAWVVPHPLPDGVKGGSSTFRALISKLHCYLWRLITFQKQFACLSLLRYRLDFWISSSLSEMRSGPQKYLPRCLLLLSIIARAAWGGPSTKTFGGWSIWTHQPRREAACGKWAGNKSWKGPKYVAHTFPSESFLPKE